MDTEPLGTRNTKADGSMQRYQIRQAVPALNAIKCGHPRGEKYNKNKKAQRKQKSYNVIEWIESYPTF
jgi:hypothetical protein